MKTIIVTPENEKDFGFLNDLLKKLGYSTRIISDEEKEESVLLQMMLETRNKGNISEEEIMKILESE